MHRAEKRGVAFPHGVRQRAPRDRLENARGRRPRLAERLLEQRPPLARVHRTKDGARAEPGEVRGDELDDLVAESTEIVGDERRRCHREGWRLAFVRCAWPATSIAR